VQQASKNNARASTGVAVQVDQSLDGQADD
jgi:hypothetical protein